jgi:membrane AbrB-like protein
MSERLPTRFSAATVLLGAVGGLIGHWSGFPTGALLGALVTVGSINLLSGDRVRLPELFGMTARALMGTVIGSLVTVGLIARIGVNLRWAVLYTVLVIILGLLIGLVLYRITDMDLRTALTGTAPGGLPEMVALAEDVGARTDLVLGLHLVRKFAALGLAILLVGVLT